MLKLNPRMVIASINGNFKGKDILTLDQFSKEDLNIIFDLVPKMKAIAQNAKPSKVLSGVIATLLFYEPSSRTFGSFSASVKQLGGQTVEILNPQVFSSVVKGENFADTIRTFEAYCDIIVLRHKELGSAQKAAEVARLVPVINAGDGVGEHPTQALLDLYTIYEKHKRLENLVGVVAGDMLNGRTVHSLIRGLSLFKNNVLYLLSPKELKLSRQDFEGFKKKKIQLIEIESEKDLPKNAHFWYWTRVQKERFADLKIYEKVKNRFVVAKKLFDEKGGKDTLLMHPLPRVFEIDEVLDLDERAVYLRSQIRNGMYVRMALLALVLRRT